MAQVSIKDNPVYPPPGLINPQNGPANSPYGGFDPAYPPPGLITPQKWEPPVLTEDEKETKRVHFEGEIKQQKNETEGGLVGIAIVLGVVDSDAPQGTDIDLHKIKETFRNLKFGVWKVENPTAKDIAAVIHVGTTHEYMTETWCHCILFYFAGHGGSHNGKGFVIPSVKKTDHDNNMHHDKYYIDEGIVYPFQPNKARHLGSRFRLFFFDCCLKEIKQENKEIVISSAPKGSETPSSLPPRGQCLVAYATSLHYPSSGDFSRGGTWTNLLCQNIDKYSDKYPISFILDKTYDDVVYETDKTGQATKKNVQGPHYNSSIGLFYLKYPFRKEFPDVVKPVTNTSSAPITEDISTPVEDVDIPEIDISEIMEAKPDKDDLDYALQPIEADQSIWKEKFGGYLVKKEIVEEKDRKNWSKLEFMTKFFIRNNCNVTWGIILEAADYMKNEELKRHVMGHMTQREIFEKYKQLL
jgi:hypothetical protein